MKSCLGIILNINNDDSLSTLTKHRPAYMLPYAGRYRIIDFALSTMVNHNIVNIGLYSGPKIMSSLDHLEDGKSWGLNRRYTGLKLFTPSHELGLLSRLNEIEEINATRKFFEDAKEDYVFMMRPDIITQIDLNDAFKKFRSSDADITLIYSEENHHLDTYGYEKLTTDSSGRLQTLGYNRGTEEKFKRFLKMGFIKKEVLLHLTDCAVEHGDTVNFDDLIMQHNDNLSINTYEYHGFVQEITDLKHYYHANLELIHQEKYRKMFFSKHEIYTKTKDEPPTIYKNTSRVKNSMIANGCVIKGQVENSIIFRGVIIEEGAVVKNSILMQKSSVGKDSTLNYVITDKNSRIDHGMNLIGDVDKPFVLEKYGVIGKDG